MPRTIAAGPVAAALYRIRCARLPAPRGYLVWMLPTLVVGWMEPDPPRRG